MSKWMTISEAVDAFDLYNLFSEIIDSYSDEMDDPEAVASELIELLEEHEEEYEFSSDSDGDYSESFERNLRDAIGYVFEEFNLGELPEVDYVDPDTDEDDLADIYDDKFDDDIKHRVDMDAYEEGDDIEEEDAD
ncbi:hypothetical protein [Desulfotignum balticum]|jgi:hypothetical protein|uniref:hypothetical protein n=1 Tax=Desulfotignum balticum TaxID=115781 RepID=UPI0004056CB7|nr:hypothetical protein [Desulfotignum balticum]